MMAATVKKLKASMAAQCGAAGGIRLASRAASVMLQEYFDQPPDPRMPAPYVEAIDTLRAALGPALADPAIMEALHVLDDAHGRELVAATESAWYAAWQVARGLVGRSSP